MRRYLVWSLAFHAVFALVATVIAPLRGFSDPGRLPVVISVGLVDYADPGKVKGESPKPPTPAKPQAPEPAEDEAIAKDPTVKQDLAEAKVPEKPKKTDSKKSDTKKPVEKPAKKDTAKTASPILASADTGGVSGSVTDGAGGGDIWGVETGADVNPYHRQGFASIRGNWRNPAIGRETRLCVVMFRVLRTGELTDIEIEKKSGSDLFDRAALRAVQVTGTWPPFPSHWEENEQIIHLEFEYRP